MTNAPPRYLIFHSSLDFEVVIVDDSSPDNTAEVAKQLQLPGRIILEQRTKKQGLGTAYVNGCTLIQK